MSLHIDASEKGWIRLETVDSTNQYLLRSEHSSGTVVMARHQTAGRGRRGRTWLDRPGATFLFSTLLVQDLSEQEDSAYLGFLPLVTGLAVLQASTAAWTDLGGQGEEGIELSLKWPNDVIRIRPTGHGDPAVGKLAGVLVESELQGSRLRLVIGVGLNWKSNGEMEDIENGQTAPLEGSQLRPVPLFLDETFPVDPMRFAEYLVPRLNHQFQRIHQTEDILHDLAGSFFLAGKVLVREGVRYRVEGLDSSGALVVRSLEDHSVRSLYDMDWEKVETWT